MIDDQGEPYIFQQKSDDAGGGSYTFTPSNALPIPSPSVLDLRAKKLAYAESGETPPETFAQEFSTGNEQALRQTFADRESLKNENARTSMLTHIASSYSNLTPEEMAMTRGLTRPTPPQDPSSVFEKLYGTKFANDVANASEKNPKPADVDAAADVKTRKEWLNTQHENNLTAQQNEGWGTTIKNFAVEMVPFLPWWRQANALADRPNHNKLLPGQTMLENIQYLYALPFDQMKDQYAKAMEYFDKSGNSVDKLTFSQAMVAYGTSDQYLSNAMGVADYTVVLPPALKLAGRLARGLRVAERTAVATDEVAKAATAPVPAAAVPEQKLLTYQGSDKFKTQPDLFGEQPEQGAFRFMQGAEQKAPTQFDKEAALPPGKVRATHTTDFATYGEPPGYELPLGPRSNIPENGLFRDQSGKIRRSAEAYKQGELPIGEPVQHQLGLDLAPPKVIQATPEAVQTIEGRRALTNAIKATDGDKLPAPDSVLAAAGEVKPASFIGAVKNLLNDGVRDLARELPTFANPTGFLQDSKVISRARAQLLGPGLKEAGDRLVNNFWNLAKVSRVTSDQLVIARNSAEAALKKEYGKRLNDAIIDVRYTPAEFHAANIDTVSLRVGMPDASMFPTAEKAAIWREQYGLGSKEAHIVPEGGKYLLEIPKHVDETQDIVRDAVVSARNATNSSLINQLLNRVRSAEDLFGFSQRENRQIAVHAPQALRRALRQEIEQTFEKNMTKQQRRAVEDVLRDNRDMPNPANPTERGRWYNTAGEFEQAYFARHQRMPTENEILAYDQYKRLSDFDWLLRNVTSYRDKARQGIETFRFSALQDGKKVMTDWFEGKRLDAMPWKAGNNRYDAGLWVHDHEAGTAKFYYQFNMTPEERKIVDHLVEDRGYRVVQVFEPRKHPLAGIAKTAAGEDLKDQVNYVVTNTWDKAPLSWKQVDYRPGGHVIYPHEWYVAQPQIQAGRLGKMTYLGDNNILNVRTQAEASKWAQKLDNARQLYRDGKMNELYAYIDKQLPHTRDEFLDLFRRNDSPLSVNHPVLFKQRGHNTVESGTLKAEVDSGNMINSLHNPHDLSNTMDKSFLMDRDNILSTVVENDKSLRLGNAEQLDPYIAMNRGFSQNLRNMWLNDYKISAVEQWIKEFNHVMRPDMNSLEKHSLFFLYNPQWAKVAADNAADLAAAKAAQRAIVNFIGKPSELGEGLESMKMKLLNTVYKGWGQGKMLDLALATTTDPIHFLRGVAFHTKLGVFNPVQFFVQAATMAHSVAVSGVTHGVPGMTAAPLIRWLGHNPNMLDAVAGVAEKVGWKRAQFKEMYQTLQKTGLYEVAGEATLRDDAFDPHLFRNTFGRYILDAGPMFFNEGERMTRLTAWATSFREFRAANPTVTLGNREIGAILRRADDLSVNMTRASNAAWQSGVWSIPTQFYAYNARVMEQLLGGRLTGLEKTRVLATYSALYGIPLGLGTAVGGIWPVYDTVREEAYKRGINLNEGWAKVATEGLLSTATSWLTGHDYNLSQRYAPGNQQAVREALNGDKSFQDIIGGASGTIVGDMIKATYPAWYWAYSVAHGGPEFKPKSSDFMSVARNVSTFDVAAKMFGAYSYGTWSTKTGTNVAPADTMDAIMTAFGLTPKLAADTFLWQHALRHSKEVQQQYESYAMEQYRRGLQAGVEQDFTGMEEYFKRANVAMEYGDFNFAERGRVWKKMVDQNRLLSDKVKWDAFKYAPQSRVQDIYNTFIKSK